MRLMFSQDEINGILTMVEEKANEEKTVSEFLDLPVRESAIGSKL